MYTHFIEEKNHWSGHQYHQIEEANIIKVTTSANR